MNVFKLEFLARACFKVVVRTVKNWEAIVFLVEPYYLLPYLMIALFWKQIILRQFSQDG